MADVRPAYPVHHQNELIEHHMSTNNAIVAMRLGSSSPLLVVQAAGARLKSRLESYFANSFIAAPFVVVPTPSTTEAVAEEVFMGTLDEVTAYIEGKSLYTALHTEKADVAVFGVHMLDTPSLDSTIVARCQPLDDVAAMTAFAETHTAIFEEQDQDKKKVLKSTAFDPFLQMSVLSEKLAGAALSFLMDFVHSVRITQRYIARAYAVTRQVYTPEEIARDDVLWAQLAGTRTRVIGIPKSIAKPVTDTISDRVDAEAEPSFELDPKSFTHVLFAFQAYNRVAYCLLPRGDWAIPAVVPRQTTAEAGATSANADAAVGGWVNTAACKGRVSRAYYKLEEVFEYLQREPAFKEAVDRAVANDTCPASTWGWWNKPQTDGTRPLTCDVGACPGGWSLSLAARGAQVLAIDPGMLSIQHPQITHVPHKLQAPECVERLNAGGPLDMVVCDVNCDIGMTTDIVLDNIVNPGLMRPGSIVVLTVKAFNKGAMNDQIKHALRLLEAKFDCLQTTWLLANRRERTIVGVRKQW